MTSSNPRQFGIFAKYWEPGQVKTRLAQSIGEAAAAEIYRQFVATLLCRFGQVAERRVLACWPAERSEQFAEFAGSEWQLERQTAGDLGRRIEAYFASALAAGATRVVLIGSDSPTLPLDYVETAFQALDDSDVVLGPADDGGYYLVGLSRPVPEMFAGIQWSSSCVFEQTVERLSQLKLTWSGLPEFYDVDSVDDLARLQDELSGYRGTDEALIRLRHSVDLALRKVNRHA